MIEFRLLLEHYLRTRKQADRNSWLSNRGKAAGRRAGEACGHELVANLGRAGCGVVQTVVTHLNPPRSPGPMGPIKTSTRDVDVGSRRPCKWWKRAGLEPASPACKAGALPN